MNFDSFLSKFRIQLKIIKICFYIAFVLLFAFIFFDAALFIFNKKSIVDSNLFDCIFHLLFVFLCGFSLQNIEKYRCITNKVTGSIRLIGYILMVKAVCYYSLFPTISVAIDFSVGPFRFSWIEFLYGCLLLLVSRLLNEIRIES